MRGEIENLEARFFSTRLLRSELFALPITAELSMVGWTASYRRGRGMIIVTEKVLEEMVAAIVQESDPDQSYLFGSRACGEARPDASIDLCIVEQAPFGPCRSRFRPALHNSCHSQVGRPSLCRLPGGGLMTTEIVEPYRDQCDVFLSYHWRDHRAVEQATHPVSEVEFIPTGPWITSRRDDITHLW
jgi:hypothetical protein